jgi:PHD/YefM family antitoxin component YafN of YafNO toxin-antitoxin module
MIAANFTEFRTGLKKYLDSVENDNETLIIKRKTGKGTVVISLDEYNSMMKTVNFLKLLQADLNGRQKEIFQLNDSQRESIEQSKSQIENGEFVESSKAISDIKEWLQKK